ncbi:MAG: TraR/DksA C4-type zinc finger protein [Chitinophagales bacterium]
MAKKKVVKKSAKPAAKKSKSVKKGTTKKPAAKKASKKPLAKKAAIKKPAIKKTQKKVTAKKPAVKKPISKVKVTNKPLAKKAVVKKPASKPIPPKKVEKPVKKQEIKKPVIVEVKKQQTPIAPPLVAAKVAPLQSSKKGKKSFAEKREMNRLRNPLIRPFKPLVRQPVIKVLPKIQIPVVDPNKTRYSDEELTEFKDLIVRKLENARNELKYMQEQISRSSELGGDDDARFKGIEDGTMHSEREYLSQMASRQIQYISHLEKALVRIENKTYGICRETGKLISKERLRAVPHATLSMEAKVSKG